MVTSSLIARGALALALGVSLASFQDAAQPPASPVTYIAEWQVNRGMEQAYVDLVDELYAPAFQRLMNAENPAVLSWGVYESYLHAPDRPTHAMWYTAPSMAALDRVDAAFEAIGEMDIAAVEASAGGVPKASLLGRKIDAIADVGTHRDLLIRHLVFEQTQAPTPEGHKPIFWLFHAKVKPGKGRAYKALWDEHYKPVFDGWVQSGTVQAFGLGVQAVGVTNEWTHTTWMSFKDFASYEKAYQAWMAAEGERSEEDIQAREAAFMDAVDPDASRSQVVKSVTYHAVR